MKIDFKDIIISPAFESSIPKSSKMERCRNAYDKGILDREIVLNGQNVLIDGYVLYLVMKEQGVNGKVEVRRINNKFYRIPTTYVYGKHLGQDKEYVWYINMSYQKVKDMVGQLADVETRKGIQTITITKVKRSLMPPVNGVIRRVVHI